MGGTNSGMLRQWGGTIRGRMRQCAEEAVGVRAELLDDRPVATSVRRVCWPSGGRLIWRGARGSDGAGSRQTGGAVGGNRAPEEPWVAWTS